MVAILDFTVPGVQGFQGFIGSGVHGFIGSGFVDTSSGLPAKMTKV
jgi:hypothetical protein